MTQKWIELSCYWLHRIKSAEKQYIDAFEDELKGFIERVQGRAKVRLDEAIREAEEEEKKQRMGPGGLDPVEVMDTLPPVSSTWCMQILSTICHEVHVCNSIILASDLTLHE